MKSLHGQILDLHDSFERKREEWGNEIVALNAQGRPSKDAITMARLYTDLIETLLPYLDK